MTINISNFAAEIESEQSSFGNAPGSLNVASFLGFSQIVHPSGDATGATDLANINAALAGGTNTSIYLNGNYTISGTIIIPSNVTLVLADASITLAAAKNVPMIANPSFASPTTPAASNINIRGIGRALLDYNGVNQTLQGSAFYNSCTIVLVNVSTFSLEGLQFTDAQYVHVNMQACSDGTVKRSHCAHTGTDKGFMHADWGCSNITIDGATASGIFADSVFSMNTVDGTAAGRTPFATALVGAANNITGISIRNVTLASSTGMISIAPGGSFTVTDVDVENIHNIYSGNTTGNEIDLGAAGYSGATLPVHGAVAGIRFKGYTFGGANHSFLALGTDISDLHVTGVRATGTVSGLISAGATLPANYYPQITNINFNDVVIPTLGAGGALSTIPAGYVVQTLRLTDITVNVANNAMFKHTSDVSGLKASIKVGTLNANPFQSTGNETGEVSFTYDTKGLSLTSVFSSASAFKVVPPFPAIWTPDTTPQPVHGSELDCYAGKDPTGGAATTGGKYKGDGVKWNLVTGLNGTFRPAQMYYPLLVHYDASAITVANGAAVPKWTDLAGVNNSLVQVTGANQPTFVAADATLNGRPSVAFNGTTQFLQNTLLTPLFNSKPYMAFIVYYYSALQAASWIFQAATTGATGDTFFRYFKNGTVNNVFNGTSGVVAGATTLVANTAYIGCVGVTSAASGQIGENKAALASLATGSVNSVGTISGLTVGAGFTPNNWAPIHVAELFIYTGSVTSSDYATVMSALATKYAVTLV